MLRCPICLTRDAPATGHGEHRLDSFGGSWLVGSACSHKYRILDSIPVLTIEEGERWADTDVPDLPVPPPQGDAPIHPIWNTHNTPSDPKTDLSIIIPALNEELNLIELLPNLRGVLDTLPITCEILLITPRADVETYDAAARSGVDVVEQSKPGYGGALMAGIARARGAYLLTMDADLSHPPDFIRDLWSRRRDAEITIASRYIPGGSARVPRTRYFLSRVLNVFFGRGLSLSVRDMSSGFRLLRADVIRSQSLHAHDFDIVQEMLVRAYADGWRVQEVPFTFAPHRNAGSYARVLRFGLAYLKTFWSLWRFRNSISSADYDDRAYDSPIFLQRYWQRSRFRYVTELISGEGPVLDVGCGSSRIISALPSGSVGMDILMRKLRYARKFGTTLVQASGFHIPFPDESFQCVLCSQVIEHVPKDSPMLVELCRVLAPGGRLVLGTPDYASWVWVLIEKLYGFFAPGGYADEHITRYTHEELIDTFQKRGLTPEANRYILRSDLMLAFRKPG